MLILFFLFGLIAGSFVNTLIYRLPRSLGPGGRSICPNCKSRIAWYDLIPLLSFVFLRGRCRKCAKRISLTYPFVELLTALVFVQFARSVVLTPENLIFGLFILSVFIALAFIDAKHFILPDAVVYALIIISVAFLFLHPAEVKEKLFGMVLFGGFFAFLFWLSGGKWLGFGDVKLAAAIGLVFGWLDGLFVINLAVLTGAAFGVILMLLKRANMKTKIPFGAFLSGASIIFLLFGKIIYIIVIDIFT